MKDGKWVELWLITFIITIIVKNVLESKEIIQDDNIVFSFIYVCYLIIFLVLGVIYLYIKNKPNNQ